MTLYTGLATKVVGIIRRFGAPVDLVAHPADAADDAKPWRGPDLSGEPLTVSPRGVRDAFTTKEQDGERIRATDLKLYVAATDPALTGVSWDVDTTLFCDLDGRRYGALVLEVVKPGDTALLYTLRLRLG